jgi:flagellar biosynthesis protein FliQ
MTADEQGEFVNITQSFRDLLDTVIQFLPKLVAFLVILIVGYFIAKILQKVVDKVLEKVGFDRAVERGGVKKALEKSQYDASDILAKIVFYAVMLFVLSTAFGVFGPNPISTYLSAVIGYLPKVFVAILILVIASAVAAGVKLLVQNALGGLSYGKLLANAVSVVIIALGVIAALDQLEIAQNVVNAVLYASLAALVGVIVVAVGGGGIAPMRQRWEQTLAKVEAEAPRAAAEVGGTDPVAAVRTEAESYAGGGVGSGGGTRAIPTASQTSSDGGATGYRRQ